MEWWLPIRLSETVTEDKVPSHVEVKKETPSQDLGAAAAPASLDWLP